MGPCQPRPGQEPARGRNCFASLPPELQRYIVDWVWHLLDSPAREKGVEPLEAEVFECFGSLGLVSRRMRELVAPHLWKVSFVGRGDGSSRPAARLARSEPSERGGSEFSPA